MRVLLLCGIALASLPAPGLACDALDLLVPVSVQFEQPEFRHRWIYHSLEPRLLAPRGNFRLHSSTVDRGTLRLEFCGKRAWIEEEESFELLLASRRLRLVARPVRQESAGQPFVTMSPIVVAKFQKPDWVAVQSMRVIPESDPEAALFEITLVNFASFASAHDTLVFSAGGHRFLDPQCVTSHSREQETYLNFDQVLEGKGAESWTMLGGRKVKVSFDVIRRCGREPEFNLKVPIQVGVAPLATQVIVLRIFRGHPNEVASGKDAGRLLRRAKSTDLPRERAAAAGELIASDDWTWWKHWPDLRVAVRGTQIFPETMPLDQKLRGSAN
jgi:hypothetical protein